MTETVVVIGLGYVGLPVALESCMSGFEVIGFDISKDLINDLNRRVSHIDDVKDSEIEKMFDRGFTVTDDPKSVENADYTVICVPTPLSDDGVPDMRAVIEACEMIAPFIKKGSVVSLESTTYPGTTDGLVRKKLENNSGLTAGEDFALVYSPERIDPGNERFTFRNTPKLVAGLTEKCLMLGLDFYSRIVEVVVPTTGLREAELAKLIENTYRHVNIALMNELAVFCHELGVNIWDSIEAAKTKPFGFEAFYPGPGVGGHCIPIDPNYLSWVVRSIGQRFRLVELAQEVSERMPAYIAKRVQDSLNFASKAVKGSKILLLGVTYKPNVSDKRQTPAIPLTGHLLDMGANVSFYDPYVENFFVKEVEIEREESLINGLNSCDLAILLTAHNDIIESEELKRANIIFDTRGVLSGKNVEKL